MKQITAFKTSDNRIFEDKEKAKHHQVLVDLCEIYNQSNLLDDEDFLQLLKNNKEKLLILIPKL